MTLKEKLEFTLVDKDRKESFNKLLIYSGIILYF